MFKNETLTPSELHKSLQCQDPGALSPRELDLISFVLCVLHVDPWECGTVGM